MPKWFFALVTCLLLPAAQAGSTRELGVLPTGAVAWQREITQGDRTIKLSGVSFDGRKATFRVIDNPPAARQTFAELLAAQGAFAGVNASYFHDNFTPLGLVISDGQPLHSFEKAKLLSGILAVRKSGIVLVRSDAYKAGPDVLEAVQSGPWLVAGGAPAHGLDSTRVARRTVVATDGKNHWAIITTGPLTLADTARALTLKDLAGPWTIVEALNLDGGGSTTLLASDGTQTFFDIRSFGPVRNYLAILPRQR